MYAITILLLIVILILLIINNSSASAALQQIRFEINQLRGDLLKISNPIKEKKEDSPKETTVPYEAKEDKEILRDKYGPVKETIVEDQPAIVIPEPIIPEPSAVYVQSVNNNEPDEIQPEPKINVAPPPTPHYEKPRENKPRDWEKFIGENLMSKIGIIIFVLGIGYFVKYAIDKNWIGEFGRVAIGILAGGAIIFLAHKMRKTYKTFSSILTGGGLAVLYLTISIAFHQYHIFTQTAAFALLVLITVFSVFLSLAYDKIELAIFSQFGGFAVPFMISTGEGNYVVLFSYLLILNIGLIAIAYYKRWHTVNLLAFVGTQLIFFSWLIQQFVFKSNPPFAGALMFGSAFYLIFFLLNILNNIKERKTFNGIEIGMILSNNLSFFTGGMIILNQYHHGVYNGLFTVIMGGYNFGWILFLYNRKNIDKTLIYLLIGLVLSFVSLSIPIQLKGHTITLFWSAELVILLWLAQKSKISLLRTAHLLILVLVVISLMMDWQKFYFVSSAYYFPALINKAFVTGMVALVSLGITRFLLNAETDESSFASIFPLNYYKTVINVLLFTGAYLVFYLELKYQLNKYFEISAFHQSVFAVFNFAFLATSLLVNIKFKLANGIKTIVYLSLFMFVIYLIYHIGEITDMRDIFISTNRITLLSYSIHYLVFIPMFYLVYYIGKNREVLLSINKLLQKSILWFLVFFILVVLSAELNNISLILLPRPVSFDTQFDILKQVHKSGYLILWGVCAFSLMILGMKLENKTFRIQSITIFGVIIVKLIFVDIWDMNEGGRIATFILLGLILLVISFLYQKLKNLVITGDVTNSKNEAE